MQFGIYETTYSSAKVTCYYNTKVNKWNFSHGDWFLQKTEVTGKDYQQKVANWEGSYIVNKVLGSHHIPTLRTGGLDTI